jgi:hypothetical protein
MNATAWIVTAGGLLLALWVVWYFWLYKEPDEADQRQE